MIRDQFKDAKKATSKETRGKTRLGERNFYATQIPRLKEATHVIGVSSMISFVLMALVYLLVAVTFLVSRGTEKEYSPVRFAVWSAVFGVCCVWMIVWFFVLKPKRLARAEAYRKELEKLNFAHVSKIGGAYKVYGSAFEEETKRGHDELKPKESQSAENGEANADEESPAEDPGKGENEGNEDVPAGN